ncbi:Low-density lipoprotein receptor-related protein 4 [Mactra antiquata]
MIGFILSFCLVAFIQVSATDNSECSCPPLKFSCGNCVCIPQSLVCDGQPDCENGNDEQGCGVQRISSHCPADHFTCWNQQCIRLDWVCDNDNDCGDDSDELMCPPKNCTEDEFQCNNGNCVLAKWRCDGDDDCRDGSDERCVHECSPSQFKCEDDGTCVDKSWVCDKEVDCHDASDEASCGLEDLYCGPHEFTCVQAHRCIPLRKHCDKNNDCNDWEDEIGCDFLQSETRCRDGEFKCDHGLCINSDWVCDGQIDCEDSSDEKNCTYKECRNDEFRCKIGYCIDGTLRCNGQIDCSDNSDEINCGVTSCGVGQFHCISGECIGNNKVCNSEKDCNDGSDEVNCRWAANCNVNNGGCDQLCQQTAHGAKCSCRRGYQLLADGHECVDFNECDLQNVCSQICVNTPGSFRCDCKGGYILKPDGRGCKVQVTTGEKAYLIFANRVDIRRVMPDMSEYDSILQGLENAIALDFHHEKGYVYWSDVTLDKIKRAYLNGSGIKEVVAYGLESPGGVAVDWIHNILFWTDSGTSRIEVSNLDGDHRKVLLWENLEKPRAIAVHPGEGFIFWTDWGSTPKIERSSMDGQSRLVIANTSLFWPNGLTLDYAAEKLYWADAKHHVIECSNYDGTQRRTVINQGLPHPFALTLFEDELYWTDWHTKSINKANKFTGNDVETVRNRLHFPMDIHIFHHERQPEAVNRCNDDRGGCSHLCLPSTVSYKCACPTGLHLKKDKKTCVRNIESFMLFTTRSDVRRITLGTPDQSDVVIPLSNTVSTMSVDFDDTTDTIYWTDSGTNAISAAKWDGRQERVVVGSSVGSPAGLAVDWATRKLYWTDSEMGRIEVSNLDGSMRGVLIWSGLQKPRDIVVDPISGYMFWTDWDKPSRIERAGMNGQGQTTLISKNLTHPNGLTIDYKGTPRLYWIDTGTLSLESCNLDGKDKKIVFTLSDPRPFGFTIFEDSMYWADWLTKKIIRSDKDGNNQITLQSNMVNVMDLTVFHRKRPDISTMCQENNGQCSHLCLPAPLPWGHTCACPTGILLNNDLRTCNLEMNNFLIFAQRTDIRKISLDVDYFADVALPIQSLKNAIAISVDRVEGKVYWTDTVLDKIQRSSLNGTNIENVISNGLDTPDGMVVDEIGRKIYWTDTGLNRIEVSNLDGSMRRVLIWEKLDKPRAITLFYEEGYLFWTDWGKEPKIERSELDGNNRRMIVSDNIIWPNGLTIDKQTSRILWADARTEKIESVDLNGGNRKVIVQKVAHPYNLAISGKLVYWTDWQKTAVYSAKKDGSTPSQHVEILPKLAGIMDIHAVHMNEKVNLRLDRCRRRNGGCSHLCLPNRRGVTCSCPSGLQLQSDRLTCETMPEEYILFASRESIRRISLDLPDMTDVYLPLPDLHNIIAIDYDYNHSKLYYSDVQLDVIRRADLNGTNAETIIDLRLNTTDGVAVDWIGDNLYWTDTGTDVIEVARLSGQYRRILIKQDLDQPRAIAVYPQKGYLYWTDWGYRPRIERSYMDGTNRKIIINSNLGFPNGLSIDYMSDRIYWVDAKLDKIETSTLDGNYRVTLIQNVPHPFGLTVFGDYVYWTDWQSQQIERADKSSGHRRETIKQLFVGLMDIEIVSPFKQTGINDCTDNNGGCTHLCLARPDGRSCLCPDYNTDNITCISILNNEDHPTNSGKDKSNSAGCTSIDQTKGLCTMSPSHESPSLDGAYIALSCVIVFVILGLVLIIFLWKRQKRRQHYMEDFSTLTFTNPNYQRTSTETINSERPLREWRIFRFNKRADRVSVVSSNCTSIEKLSHSETDALYPASSDTDGASCFPDTPLNKNIFKPKNSSQNNSKKQRKVPYKPVEKSSDRKVS